MNLWNQRDLKAPPICTYLEKQRDLDLGRLLLSLKNAEVIYKSQKHLDLEAALLGRCLYLVKTKFRMFKFVRGMEKVNQGLLRYLEYNFQNDLANFTATIPKRYESQTYFPNRNLIDHLLVKMQGLAKLFSRIGECTLDTAATINEHMAIGHLWQMLLVFFGITARIFAITKRLLKVTCQLYNELIILRHNFQIATVPWLMDGYTFPKDLNQFIDVSWLNEEVILTPNENNILNIDQSEDTQNGVIEEIVEENNKVVEQIPLELLHDNTDIGDLIESAKPVDENKVIPKAKTKRKAKLNNDNPACSKIRAINSKEELKVYMKMQNKRCNSNIKSSDFKHLDKLQWNMLYNSMKILLNKCSGKKEMIYLRKAKDCLLESF